MYSVTARLSKEGDWKYMEGKKKSNVPSQKKRAM